MSIECPRCHKQVPEDSKACPYCHMLLKFEKKNSTFNKFINSLLENELDSDGIEYVDYSYLENVPSEIAHKNYLIGFFFTIDRMISRFFIGILVLVILFVLIGPLLALPLFFMRDVYFWYFMLFLIAIMPFVGAYNYRFGKCPYCSEEIRGVPQDNALTCKTCKNRVLVKNNHFYKINN
ncbi:MAG: hypothetical protein AB9883_07685 [Acidaminococcaceae bacterium]